MMNKEAITFKQAFILLEEEFILVVQIYKENISNLNIKISLLTIAL